MLPPPGLCRPPYAPRADSRAAGYGDEGDGPVGDGEADDGDGDGEVGDGDG